MYPMGMSALQSPMLQAMNSPWLPQQYPYSPMFPSPLSLSGIQQFPSPLSSMPQIPGGYDPILYSGITGLFANAIRSSMTQSQPNVLATALTLAASQAQARSQPPDLLTAALVQALAQNMQQGIQPISNTRLVQALSQALSQAQPSTLPSPNYPPAPVPAPATPYAPAPAPVPVPAPARPPSSQQQPLPIQTPVGAPYQVIPPVTSQDAPARNSRSNSSNNEYSVNRVGKALANALIKAARKVASHEPRLTSRRRKGSRYRHHHRSNDYESDHYSVRSFVPLLYPHSPHFNYERLNMINKKWTGHDMEKYFAMFRSFWKRISTPCHLRGCNICQRFHD